MLPEARSSHFIFRMIYALAFALLGATANPFMRKAGRPLLLTIPAHLAIASERSTSAGLLITIPVMLPTKPPILT